MRAPLLYEINTRCWLAGLAAQLRKPVTLASVPETEFERWRGLGFTHLWLMGVWSTGPRALAQALCHPDLRRLYDQLLPGWTEADIGGSPYAIAEYRVSTDLGGDEGLAKFRARLHAYGLKLLLDYVPNHLGLDHPWVTERPELFVQSPRKARGTFPQQTRAGLRWLAHGQDPYFPPWTDTVQLDYRLPATRKAMVEVLHSVAERCDGVRCDMAMLLLNDVFARTWRRLPAQPFLFSSRPKARQDQRPSPRLAPPPLSSSGGEGQGEEDRRPEAAEFWQTAIAAIRRQHPNFLFLAEAYWGLEPRLQALGFDYTYDKTLLDNFARHDAAGVQRHLLQMPPACLAAGTHFLENHDEPRAASILTRAAHRAAALVILGLPGMTLLHEGQLTGARVKLPVQLRRRPPEPPAPEVESFYRQLLELLPRTVVRRGEARLLDPRPAWAENPTAVNILLVQWQAGNSLELIAVNLAPHPSQCYAPLRLEGLPEKDWTIGDLLGDAAYHRSGKDLRTQGLYLDLPAHAAQLLSFG